MSGRATTIASTGLALLVLVGGVSYAVTEASGPAQRLEAVGRSEAREVAQRLLAIDVDDVNAVAEICNVWADSQGMCRNSSEALLTRPRGSGRLVLPQPGSATLIIGSRTQVGRIVEIRGRLKGGGDYRSAVEVVRDEEGRLTFVDPIYWLPRSIDNGGALTAP